MNQKTVLVDTGSAINAATTYAGMLAYCTSTGSGFVVDTMYQRNATNTAWNTMGRGLQAYLNLSTTIGDYTAPNAVVVSSCGSTASQSFDTAGTDEVLALDTTNSRCGEKVTDTTTRNKAISSMTVRLKSNAGATGTLVYKIRKTSDSSVVATSTQSLNAATLTSTASDYTLNFAGEILPNENYYAVVEGIASGQVQLIGTLSSTSANGVTSYWDGGAWNDLTRDCRISIAYSTNLPSYVYDDNTGTEWISLSEANPNFYIDLSGSAREIVGVALNIDKTNTTVTSLKIRASTDTTFTDGETIAYVNISDFTDDTWRFLANNFLTTNCRYVQIYANEAGVLAINEIKVRYGVSDTNKILGLRVGTRVVSVADSFVDSN